MDKENTGYVDIHAHVLPGIDDGPRTFDDALEMLSAAAHSGTTRIVSTPHLRSDFPSVDVYELADHCASMQERLANEEPEPRIELVCGAEVALAWALEATDEELRLASYGQRGTDLLIETPLTTTAGLDTFLYELRMRGFRITLAHPERSRDFQRDQSPLNELVEQGILLQVNGDTLLGAPRRSRTAALGFRLCAEGMISALASDGHRAGSWRPVTHLSRAAEVVSAMVGPDRARWMLIDAPTAIVDGGDLPAPPAMVARRSKARLLRGRR